MLSIVVHILYITSEIYFLETIFSLALLCDHLRRVDFILYIPYGQKNNPTETNALIHGSIMYRSILTSLCWIKISVFLSRPCQLTKEDAWQIEISLTVGKRRSEWPKDASYKSNRRKHR